jgi:hypothetical protein
LGSTAAINQEAQDLADRRGCSHQRSAAAAHRRPAGHLKHAINAADEALSGTSASLEPESSSQTLNTTESSDEPDDFVSGAVKIGQTFTYEDGLKVSVVSAKKDAAGQDPIEGSPGDPTAIITIKITNGTVGYRHATPCRIVTPASLGPSDAW